MYIDDSDSRYPLAAISRTGAWYRLLRPWCSDSNDMLLCPMATRYEVNKNDPHPLNASVDGFGMGSKYTAWKCPFGMREDQALGGNIFYGSYGMDSSLLGSEKHPTQMPLLLDCAGDGVSPKIAGDGPPAFDGELRPAASISWVCIDRHQGAINGLFCDITIRKVGLKELWTLKWSERYDTGNRWTKAGGVQPEDWPEWMRGFKDY